MPKINLKRSSDNKKLKSNRLKCTLPVKKTLNKSPTNVVDIGFNIKRWISTKLKLSFENDCDFINYLLDLAEKQLSRRGDQNEEPNETRPDADEEDAQKQISSNNLASRGLTRKKISKKTSEVKKIVQKRTNKTLAVKNSVKCMPKLLLEKLDAVVQNNGGLKSKDQVRNGGKTLDTIKVEGTKLLSCSNVLENKTLETILKIKRKNKNGGNKVIPNKKRVKFSTDNENVLKVMNKNKVRNIKKHKNEDNKVKNRRRIKNHDIRKAPQHSKIIQTPPTASDTVVCVQQLELEAADLKPTDDENSADQKGDIKVKVCHSCNTRHMQDECPLTKSDIVVSDSISLEKWHLGNQEHTNSDNVFTIENGCYNYKLSENIDDATDNNQNIDEIDVKFQTVLTFSETSLPSILQLQDIAPNHGLSVVVKSQVAKYTRFGPLIARSIKETDIADDCTMRDVWEIYDGTDRLYFSTENPNESNWLRYVRPSQSREERNVTVVLENKCVFLVSTKVIAAGEEMLYWIDECNSLWGKKKLEKSSCGGCNLKFAHALYYRTHCSVFHDPAFSLTIRKYHCKVCGAAVLGKENIMRHAAEMHDGRGAYQCQYCDKFFLRLNYLEMHRTYGCSSNPQRARPLCDFCGRKFCQPQKLKVHIKRMHSDMAEVLRDFQCKLCSKLLGSRAALQRHSKEVHSKDVGAVSSCPRCGKVFQNKSNLKIHMLTHSGVKPFRCCESSCNAAFTTKQCLQFHYKKVHGYTPDMMPRIERSVAYTFDAYSGGREEYELEMQARRARNSIDHMNKSNRRDILLLNNSDSESLPDLDECHQEEPNGNPITISDSSPNHQTPPMLEPFVDEKIGDNKNHINTDVHGHLVFKKNFNKEMSSVSQSLISKGSKKWLGETESPLGDDPDKIRSEDPESSQDILHYNESDILQENLYPFNPSQKLDSGSGITMEGDGRPRSMDMIEQTRSANPDALTHMYNRVSSSASMLVEAALDSVTHIDLSKPDHDSEGVIIVDQIENGLTENNMLLSSEHIDIDSMDGYNLSQDNAMHGSLEDIKIKHVDLISRNNSPNDYSIQLDSDSIGINKHEIDLSDMDHLQDQNILDIHGRTIDITSPTLIHESEIDVGSLDSSSLHRSVENYTSLHQEEFASPRPTPDLSRSIGHGQEYTIHHGSEMSSPNERVRLHYSLPHDNDLNESPAVTPVPRYDFSHQLPTDLSSDEEGMVQNLSLNLKEKSEQLDLSNNYTKQYDTSIDALELRTKYEAMDAADFRNDRNFEPLILSGELQGLDMTSRGYHHNFQMATSTNLNRYHHIYDIAERQTVDLSLTRTSGYVSPPPYSHSDVLRVVSLDLTPGGRHSVDLGLPRVTHHSHSSFTSQIQNSRLISDQSGRLIEHRLLSTEHRLLASEHSLSTNRLISDPGHLLLEQSLHPARLLSPEPHSRLLDQSRLMSDSRILQSTPSGPSDLQSSRSLVSPRGFASYSAPSGTFLPVRAGNLSSPSHMSDPSAVYHPYSGYY